MVQQVRILLVDDAPRVRHDLSAVLALLDGIRIVGEAGDGSEAILQIELRHPDVVLLDLEMPVLDGYSAAREIKRLYPAVRVIALSVHGYATARQRAFHAGVDEFVEKGAPLATLLEAIKR